MRAFGKWLGRLLLALLVLAGVAWLLAPVEQVEMVEPFDDSDLPIDLEKWLEESEAAFPDLLPEVAKEIVWAGAPGARTPLAVVYIHGFSATSGELRPVPDRVAQALGANLYFARLAGHGRGPAAMAEPTAADWRRDAAEALAIGRRLGDAVIVIATSTGGTLAALAMTDAAQAHAVKGVVFVSPNFRMANPAAGLLTLPFARVWGPWIAGAERAFQPKNDGHGRFWTTRYPTVATVPLGALVQEAWRADYGQVITPALFYFTDSDPVVSARATRDIADRWGGPRAVVAVTMPEGDDLHVIAGDILSPANTPRAVDTILAWVRGL